MTFMTDGCRPNPEEIPAGDEAYDGAVGAPQDRHAPDIGVSHAVGQAPHEFIVETGDAVAPRQAPPNRGDSPGGQPSRVQRSTSARATMPTRRPISSTTG